MIKNRQKGVITLLVFIWQKTRNWILNLSKCEIELPIRPLMSGLLNLRIQAMWFITAIFLNDFLSLARADLSVKGNSLQPQIASPIPSLSPTITSEPIKTARSSDLEIKILKITVKVKWDQNKGDSIKKDSNAKSAIPPFDLFELSDSEYDGKVLIGPPSLKAYFILKGWVNESKDWKVVKELKSGQNIQVDSKTKNFKLSLWVKEGLNEFTFMSVNSEGKSNLQTLLADVKVFAENQSKLDWKLSQFSFEICQSYLKYTEKLVTDFYQWSQGLKLNYWGRRQNSRWHFNWIGYYTFPIKSSSASDRSSLWGSQFGIGFKVVDRAQWIMESLLGGYLESMKASQKDFGVEGVFGPWVKLEAIRKMGTSHAFGVLGSWGGILSDPSFFGIRSRSLEWQLYWQKQWHPWLKSKVGLKYRQLRLDSQGIYIDWAEYGLLFGIEY